MSTSIKVTFLGTGTSQGVPVIACNCNVCESTDPRDKRLRSSVMVETKEKLIVIDTGPDFRQQMLINKVKNLDAILFTHGHKDHIAGLDDVRAFNYISRKPINVYAERRVEVALKREFAYVFAVDKYPGIPQINMHLIGNKPFIVEGIEITPIRAFHHLLPIFGFRIGNFAYITDIKTIHDEELPKLTGLEALVITTLRKEEHISHMNLDEALCFIQKIKPNTAYLTHLSHKFGLQHIEEPGLPGNVKIAYDGLSIVL